jgi:hypothetical protein
VALLAVVGGWAITHLGDHSAAPPVAASSPAPPSSTAASPSVAPLNATQSVRAQLLYYVFARAHDPAVAETMVRQDTSSVQCGPEPSGPGTADRISAYIRSKFPEMQVLDVARVLDKFAGLCSVELRARDDTGTVLVVRIIPPVEATVFAPRVDEGAETAHGLYTHFVQVTSRDGWMITAGSSGPADAGPSQFALLSVARQRSLLW